MNKLAPSLVSWNLQSGQKKNTEKIISAVALLEHELGEGPKDTGVRLSRWSIG